MSDLIDKHNQGLPHLGLFFAAVLGGAALAILAALFIYAPSLSAIEARLDQCACAVEEASHAASDD